jgi:uncharacterized protein (TIGR03083 family)
MATDPVATWRASLENFAVLLEGIDDWSIDSPCPGWTIADLLAHTIDLESMIATDPRPDHTPDWNALPHIDSDFGRMTEIGVDYRRGWSRDDLLADLWATHDRARARIDQVGLDGSIPWLRGDTPIPTLLGMRTFDIWVHEQDARVAVGDTGNLAGPGAANAMTYLTAGLPKVWGKNVGAPVGSVLHLTVTEPGLQGECWVRVNEDGKASIVAEQAADLTVTMPWQSFVMLGGGRTVEAGVVDSVVVVGDETLGQAFLDSMAITP